MFSGKKILCIGDSIGLPRDGVDYSKTWYYLLSNLLNLNVFIERFTREGTTDLLKSNDALEYYNPDCVIIQLGIVDCAPRLFKRESITPKVINRLPSSLRSFFWRLIKKFKTRSAKNSHVSLRDFKNNLKNYLDRCVHSQVSKVVIIEIGKPGLEMIKKNPGISPSVARYNEVLQKLSCDYTFVNCVSPLNESQDDWYVEDGYHLNEKGFHSVFEALRKVLDES